MHITVGSLNVQGKLDEKSKLCEFLELVSLYDIFCVQETKLNQYKDCNIAGYGRYRSDRKCKKKRTSGGVMIMYKNELQKGISKRKSKSKNIIWIKLCRKFFMLEKDIYLAAVYIAPKAKTASGMSDDDDSDRDGMLELLETEILYYESQGDIIIIGDLNGRIGEKAESHVSDDQICHELLRSNLDTNVNHTLNVNDTLNERIRFSQDKTMNTRGRKLMAIINKAHLFILNGAGRGDIDGKFTCHEYNGSSVIDLCIVSRSVANRTKQFKVLDPVWYSDHCPIQITISSPMMPTWNNENLSDNNTGDVRESYIWNEEGANKFSVLMNSPENIRKINKFCGDNYTNVEEATDALSNIIKEVAEKSLRKKVIRGKKNTNSKTPRDVVCHLYKQRFKREKREFLKDCKNLDRRKSYMLAKKQYKKAVNKFQNQLKRESITKLADMEPGDPSKFWKAIKRVVHAARNVTPMITSNQWCNHFSQLLNIQYNEGKTDQFHEYVKTALPHIESVNEHCPDLDYNVTVEEVSKTINKSKSGKAAGIDGIMTDMIKCCVHLIAKPIAHLFNIIFKQGTFPSRWDTSIIVPLHKSGDLDDPGNYRGIALSNCLGRLLTKLMAERLYNYVESNRIRKINQGGFVKNIEPMIIYL